MEAIESFVHRNLELSELNTIKDFVSKYKLNEKNRAHEVLFVRYELMRIMRKRTKLSLSDIGAYFGLKHCTVMNCLTSAENMYRFGHYKYHDIVRKYRDELENLKY